MNTQNPSSMLEEIAFELAIRPLPFMLRDLTEWLQISRVEPLMLSKALSDTLRAPRPSWVYFRAIVTRCISEGVTTVKGYEERTLRFVPAAAAAARRSSFGDYTQRTYTESQLDTQTQYILQEASNMRQ